MKAHKWVWTRGVFLSWKKTPIVGKSGDSTGVKAGGTTSGGGRRTENQKSSPNRAGFDGIGEIEKKEGKGGGGVGQSKRDLERGGGEFCFL